MMSQVYANIPQYTFEDYQGQDIRHEKVLILRLIFRIRKGAAKRGQHQCQGQNPEQEEVPGQGVPHIKAKIQNKEEWCQC
jgi:hypothetical protein